MDWRTGLSISTKTMDWFESSPDFSPLCASTTVLLPYTGFFNAYKGSTNVGPPPWEALFATSDVLSADATANGTNNSRGTFWFHQKLEIRDTNGTTVDEMVDTVKLKGFGGTGQVDCKVVSTPANAATGYSARLTRWFSTNKDPTATVPRYNETINTFRWVRTLSTGIQDGPGA